MSQENVDLALHACDAFNGRELDALLTLMDDEVVVESRLAAVEGGYRGHEGARRWWKNPLRPPGRGLVEISPLRDPATWGNGSRVPFRAERRFDCYVQAVLICPDSARRS